MHSVRPVAFRYRPSGHPAHLVAGAKSSSYVPTAHAMQPELPDAPATECVPLAHPTQVVAGLLSSSLVPALHCVQLVLAVLE